MGWVTSNASLSAMSADGSTFRNCLLELPSELFLYIKLWFEILTEILCTSVFKPCFRTPTRETNYTVTSVKYAGLLHSYTRCIGVTCLQIFHCWERSQFPDRRLNEFVDAEDIGLRLYLPVLVMSPSVLEESGGGGDARHTQTHNPRPLASSHSNTKPSITESENPLYRLESFYR